MLFTDRNTYKQNDKTVEVSVTPFFQLILCLELIAQWEGTVSIPALLLRVLNAPIKLYYNIYDYYLQIGFALGIVVEIKINEGKKVLKMEIEKAQ